MGVKPRPTRNEGALSRGLRDPIQKVFTPRSAETYIPGVPLAPMPLVSQPLGDKQIETSTGTDNLKGSPIPLLSDVTTTPVDTKKRGFAGSILNTSPSKFSRVKVLSASNAPGAGFNASSSATAFGWRVDTIRSAAKYSTACSLSLNSPCAAGCAAFG